MMKNLVWKLTQGQEIGWTHMRILEGVGTLVQLGAMISRLCKMAFTDRPDTFRL